MEDPPAKKKAILSSKGKQKGKEKMSSVQGDPDEDLIEEELDAYITEGENAGESSH